MMRLSSDLGGGFILYDDPALEIEGSLILYGLGVLTLVLLLWSAAQNPQAFAVSLFCLLVGLFFRVFFVGDGAPYFLGCLSLPFFTYFIVSSAYTLVGNAGQMGLLVWAVSGFYVVGAGLMLYGSLLADHEGVMACFIVIIGAMAWFGSLFQHSFSAMEHGVLYYTMRIVTIIALVWMVYNLVMFVRDLGKGRVKGQVTLVNLALAAIGLIPLLCVRLLGSIGHSRKWMVLAALLVLAAYGLAAWGGRKLAASRVKGIEGGAEAVLAPTVLCLIHYFANGAVMNVASETVEAALHTVNALPTAGFMVSAAENLIEAFRRLFSGALSGLLDLILRIFDRNAPSVTIGPMTTVILMSVLLAAVVVFFPGFLDRLARRGRR